MIDKVHDIFGSSDEQFASLVCEQSYNFTLILFCWYTQFNHSMIHYLKEAENLQWLDKRVVSERISKDKQKNPATKRRRKRKDTDNSEPK